MRYILFCFEFFFSHFIIIGGQEIQDSYPQMNGNERQLKSGSEASSEAAKMRFIPVKIFPFFLLLLLFAFPPYNLQFVAFSSRACSFEAH